jgi:hypothetical protein
MLVTILGDLCACKGREGKYPLPAQEHESQFIKKKRAQDSCGHGHKNTTNHKRKNRENI